MAIHTGASIGGGGEEPTRLADDAPPLEGLAEMDEMTDLNGPRWVRNIGDRWGGRAVYLTGVLLGFLAICGIALLASLVKWMAG